jgi:hypothetical protein
MSARISETFQAVILLPSVRTGAGYRPDFTPAQKVDFDTGIIAGIGGIDLGSPIIWRNLR